MSKTRPKFPDPIIKALFGRAGNHCCLCKTAVTELPTEEGDKIAIQGEIGHINAYSDNGPRPAPEMSAVERDAYDNLIMICRNCHVKIDRQEKRYSVDELKRAKVEHEAYVEKMFVQIMPSVGFQELEAVTNWLANSSVEYEEDVSLPIRIQDKIAKNELTSKSENKIRIGTIKATEVKSFVSKKSAIESQFADQIKWGFLERYALLRKEGFKGDELFDAMHLFASGNSSEYEKQSAGLAVLVYLFQACEVFEK